MDLNYNLNSDSLNSSYDDLVNELERGELTFDSYDKYKDLSDKDFFSFFLNKRSRILSTSSSEESNSENSSYKSSQKSTFDFIDNSQDQVECFNWELEGDNSEFYTQPNIEYENFIIMKSSPKSKKRVVNKNDKIYNQNNIYNQNLPSLNENMTIKKNENLPNNKKKDFVNITIN